LLIPPREGSKGDSLVNRPYYAFGMLLAFLTLAMLAVGLSSRPASRVKQPSAGGGSRLDTPRRGPGGPVFVLVVPEQPLLLAIPELGSDERADGAICGVTSGSPRADEHLPGWADHTAIASADVSVAPPAFGLASRAPWSTEIGDLSPAEIRVATDRALAQLPTRQLPAPLDYLSHYDPVYDAAMTTSGHATHAVRPALPSGDEQVDLVGLFSTFVAPAELPRLADLPRLARTEPASSDEPAPRRTRRWDYEANSIFRGAAQRAWRAVLETRLSDDWEAAEEKALGKKRRDELLYRPMWEDYEALPAWHDREAGEPGTVPADSNRPAVAARDTQSLQPATVGTLRTSELLQITVASLNRVAEKVGELLAQWLQEAGIEVATRPVAGQTTK
jgi:hypothetical protein